MRREFPLLTPDQEHLDGAGLAWESVKHGGEFWLFIHELKLPAGYQVSQASVAIKIEAGYPNAQLDMAYFYPKLARVDGKSIPCADAVLDLDGKQWQRWSRHRTGQNPWREGVDNLGTHMSLVSYWFRQEFEKKPNAVPA